MATIIDSLVVELGLNAGNFSKGATQAIEQLRKLEQANDKKSKNTEDAAKRETIALGGLKTQALELFAIFTGGAGVVSFIKDMTEADAAVGRVSRSTGISSAEISKWQGAARLMGGDAAGMAQQFVKMNDAFEGFKRGFGDPAMIAMLQGISNAGGTPIDINKGTIETYLALADNLHAIALRDGEGAAGAIGRRFGLDPSTLDMLIKGRDVTRELLALSKELGTANEKSVDSSAELVGNWNKMILAAEGLMRVIGVQHGLAKFFNGLSEILEAWSHGFFSVRGSAASKIFGGGYTPAADPNLLGSGAAGGGAQSYRSAIANIESKGSGGYAAVGPVTRSGDRAYGKYQIMGNNIGEWSQAALGKKISIAEFMSSPDAQDKIFDHRFGQYVKQFGNPQDAASAWLTGKPLSGGANLRDQNGTSGAAYAARFTAGLPGGGGSTTSVSITGPITISAGPNASAADIAGKLRDLGLKRQHDANQSSVGGE